MATMPIYGRFVGDFTAHLVAVDTEDTIAQVAAAIAAHAVGRRLPRQPDAQGFEVVSNGRILPPTAQLKDIQPQPLQWLDVRWKW